jgi:hypothetical protein
MPSQNYTPIDDLVKKHNEMKYGVGSASKEADLPGTSMEIEEVETPVEQNVEEEEVEKYVTPTDASIKLPPNLKKVGVKSVEEDLFKETLNKIKLPISDEKIMEDLKAPPSEAKRWYATILLYILERAHLTLKKVGTKVVRMFKTD